MRHTGGDVVGTGLTARLPRPRTPEQPAAAHFSSPRPTKVVVLGLDAVGLRLAVRAAELDYRVVGHETDRRRLQALAVRRSYVEGLSNARLRALPDEVFQASAEEAALADFDIAVIADLSACADAAVAVARYLLPRRAVVLGPGVRPEGTDEQVARILEAGSGLTPGIDFHLGSFTERGGPGTTPAGRVAVASFRRRLVEPPASGGDVVPPAS